MAAELELRPMTAGDFEMFWPVFRDIVRAQDSYAIDPDIDFATARRYWLEAPSQVWSARFDGDLAGSYYLKPNFDGPADHICNCGYIVDARHRGRGIARRMCEHSLQAARDAGFRAMQFNCVLSSNKPAIHLWQSLGFETIGRIPEAYRHRDSGLVDALVMYRKL